MASSQSDASSVFSSERDFNVTDNAVQQKKRRFGSALGGKPGLAKAQRELVTQAVRQHTAEGHKPKLVPPPDYENFLTKYRTVLENEPCKEILFFPHNDISQFSVHQKRRTSVPSVSENDIREAKSLFAQRCLNQYVSDWSVIQFNFARYGGDYVSLAKQCPSDELCELVYEIDLVEMQNAEEEVMDSGSPGEQAQRVLKEGWLYKGPDVTGDTSLITIKAFKKRYCYLHQDVDGSYKLDFYKDKPKGGYATTLSGVKATVYLELCSEICRSPKRGRYCFELKLFPTNESDVSGGKKSLTPEVLLAAENETQLEDWISVLQGILEKLAKIAKKAKNEDAASLASSLASEADSGHEDTLETLKAPDYAKFCNDTEGKLVLSHEVSRQNPFAVYADLEPLPDAVDQMTLIDDRVKPPVEKFGIRFLIECKALTVLLPIPAGGGKMASQVEPFFLTLFLFDTRDGGRRLSENFYADLNPEAIRKLLPQYELDNVTGVNGSMNRRDGIAVIKSADSEFRSPGEPELHGVDVKQLWTTSRKAIFSVSHPHSDVYLVVRIDKVLQGPITAGQDLYLRPDPKTSVKFQKSIPQFCSRLGRYRMPFAWAAKPVFQQFIGGTESAKDTINLYRQELDKLSDDDLQRYIIEMKKPEKGGKLQLLGQASVTVGVDVSVKPECLSGCVTSSYLPVRPQRSSPKHGFSRREESDDVPSELHTFGLTIFEMQPFPSVDVTTNDVQPYVAYQNHIYIYPLALKYDNQRHFSKARNICCWVEFRDNDSGSAAALKCLYGRFGIDADVFVHRMGTAVSHHQTCPQWYDEIKTALPVNLHERHHFLFTFVHVGVESTQKKRDDGKHGSVPSTDETVVGYAWLPLMKGGRFISEEDICLPVASVLPDGYLSCESLGFGKGYAGPDVKWVDGGKPLFRVSSRLASTVLTRDQNLQAFFVNCQRLQENGTLSDAGEPDQTKVSDDCQKNVDAISGANEHKNIDTISRHLAMNLLSVNTQCLVEFLPTILNQLFAVLALSSNEEISLGAIRAIVHVVHEACKVNKKEALKAYIKYIFKSSDEQISKTTTYEKLANMMTALLRPSKTEPAMTAVFMKNIWFFFDIMVKCMCHRLLSTGKLEICRTERFSVEFQYKVDTLVETLTLYLCQRYKEMPDECRIANKSMGYFLRACLNMMDRGFIFGLIYFVCHKLDAMESKTLKQFKIDFLQILSQHEHFLPLNIPLLCLKEGGGPYKKNPAHTVSNDSSPSNASASSTDATSISSPSSQKRHPGLFQRLFQFGVGILNTGLVSSGITNLLGANEGDVANGNSDSTALDLAHEFRLSDDYCSNHYLVGLLLRHIDYSICESRDLRKRLIVILRNLLAKHSYDNRCQGKVQTYLATLYFPLIPLLMEHLNHLELRDIVNSTPTNTLPSTGHDSLKDNSLPNSMKLVSSEQVSPAASLSIRHSNSERSVLSGAKRQMSLWDLPLGTSPVPSTRSGKMVLPRYGSECPSSASLKAVNIPGHFQPDSDLSSLATSSVMGEQNGHAKLIGDQNSQHSEIDDDVSVRTLVQHSAPGSAREQSPLSNGVIPATLPQMLSQTEPFLAYSRFDENEIRDLLICAVYILKNVSRESLGWFWQQCDHQGLMEFLRLLDLLLYHFKYQGKQRILRLTSTKLRSSHRTVSLQSPSGGGDSTKRLSTIASHDTYYKPSTRDNTILESPYSVLQEAHLAQEVGLVVLDCLASFICAQKILLSATPRSDFLEQICDMYYGMLCRQSSADLLRQVIASLKLLVKNHSSAFLNGATNLCNDLCRKVLECCNSPISSVQMDACNVLYLLMRMNYEHNGKKNFNRIHQQMIIALSQLLGDGTNLNNPIFNRALSILNGFANSDRHSPRFANEVKEVVRRLRTVLMATSQLKEHSDDPDMLADLQKSLADSYSQSPRLRETWLQNLARLHVKRQHFAEAAQCYLHMAALTSEVLKGIGEIPMGAEQFSSISDNVLPEEKLDPSIMLNDSSVHAENGDYNVDTFVNRVIQCAELMLKADRYEATGPLYRQVTPILERLRDYEALTDAYATLHDAYEKAARVNRTGKRVLGTYFRVRFYSQSYFEHEHGKDYVYREPKYTPLAEFTELLTREYGLKLGGSDIIRLISDSNPVDVGTLDARFAYIQITHVEPYHFTPMDDAGRRNTSGDYEKHTNVRQFYYDCPFTAEGRPGRTATVMDQYKRRIMIETTPKSFPYTVRRLPVTVEKVQQMNPLEAALDELKTKTGELRLILDRTPVDTKRLQLRLQGAIQPTVNAGPLAYAEAFCSPASIEKYGNGEIARLCATYKEFLTVCWESLEVNDRLITPDQFEYQQSLLHYFRDTVERLNALFGAQMLLTSHIPAATVGDTNADNRRASDRRHSSKRASAALLLSNE